MRDLLRIMRIARSQWGRLLLGIAAGVAVIAANSLLMAVSGWFITSMAVAGVSKVSFNYFIPSAAIRALAISRTVGRYLERLITHGAALRLLSELRVWLFLKFAPLSPATLERYSTGELAARLRGDIDSLENVYIRIIAPLAAGSIAIVASTLFVAFWSPSAAVALLFFLTVSGLVLPLAARQLAASHGIRAARLAGELRRVVTDGISAGDELILLGAVESGSGWRSEGVFDHVFLRAVVEAADDAFGFFAGGVGGEGELAVGDDFVDERRGEPAGFAEMAEDGEAFSFVGEGGLLEPQGSLAVELELDGKGAVVFDDGGDGDVAFVADEFFFHVQINRFGAKDGDGDGAVAAGFFDFENGGARC